MAIGNMSGLGGLGIPLNLNALISQDAAMMGASGMLPGATQGMSMDQIINLCLAQDAQSCMAAMNGSGGFGGISGFGGSGGSGGSGGIGSLLGGVSQLGNLFGGGGSGGIGGGIGSMLGGLF